MKEYGRIARPGFSAFLYTVFFTSKITSLAPSQHIHELVQVAVAFFLQ